MLYFHQNLNFGENIMANNSLGKRPCSICRKWFKPDVRQKGRQKTCGNPDCMKEQHRRQCKKWNKKNRDYFKNNYLGKKIEIAENKQIETSKTDTASQKQLLPKSQSKPVLPCEIIIGEHGIKNLIIIQYLAYQIINQTSGRAAGLHEKIPIQAAINATNRFGV